MPSPVGGVVADAAPEKPAILKESRFVVEEGLAYRILSKGAIWMNKLWLAALVLLVLWWVLAAAGQAPGCRSVPNAQTINPGLANQTIVDHGEAVHCNVFLGPTSLYLGSMTIAAFVLQVTMGLLGNVVGRKILEMTPAADEVGARRP